MLEKFWGDLGTSLFIQTALYHGTENLRTLATKSLRLTDLGKELLDSVGSFFGFFTQGLMDRLTVRQFETLRPYLNRLDDDSIHDMIEFCRRYDHWDWALQHLRPECRRRVQTAKPGPGGGLPYIVSTTRQWFPSDEELFADLDKFRRKPRAAMVGVSGSGGSVLSSEEIRPVGRLNFWNSGSGSHRHWHDSRSLPSPFGIAGPGRDRNFAELHFGPEAYRG